MSKENFHYLAKFFSSETEPAPVEAQDIWGTLERNLGEGCTDGDSVDGDSVDGDSVDGDSVDGDSVDSVDGDSVDSVDGDSVEGPIQLEGTSEPVKAKLHPDNDDNTKRTTLASSSEHVEDYITVQESLELVLDTVEDFVLSFREDEIHAYAKMASTIFELNGKSLVYRASLPTPNKELSTPGQVIEPARALMERVRDLQKAICDVYGFVNKALHDDDEKPDSFQTYVLLRMSQQLVECAYFIRAFHDDRILYTDTTVRSLERTFEKGTIAYKDCLKDIPLAFARAKPASVVEAGITTLRNMTRSYLTDGASPLANGCLYGTRTYTLEWLSEWINKYNSNSISNNPNVLFVIGSARIGKSAVARSIAKRFQVLGRLGAYISSGCSITGGEQIESLFEAITKQGGGSQLFTLKSQGQPVDVKTSCLVNVFGPVLVVIDALDECRVSSRKEVLSYLTKCAGDLPSNFRIVVLSRPYIDIVDAIWKNTDTVDVLRLNDHKGEIQKDIKTYIRRSLRGTFQDFYYNKLTTMADGLFYRGIAYCAFINADLDRGSTFPEAVQKLKTLPAILQSAQLHILQHTVGVTSVAVSPDYIVSGLWDLTLQIWNAKTQEYLYKLEGHQTPVTSLAFSPNGHYVVSGSHDKTIQIWNMKKRQIEKSLDGHKDTVTSVAFSPDGEYIASGSLDSTVQLWNTKSKQAVQKSMKGHITSVAFSPDSNFLASGSSDHTVQIWNVKSVQPVYRSFEGHRDKVTCVAFSPDGKYLASGSEDQTIQIWDMKAVQLTSKSVKGHTSWVTSVAFSPDGKYIISGSHDNTVKLWNVELGTIAGQLTGHTEVVTSVTFLDRKHIVSCSRDKTVRIWKIDEVEVMGKPLKGHTNQDTSVTVSSSQTAITNPTTPNFDEASLLDLSDYSTHMLLGAKDALNHINAVYEDIKKCFSTDMISEYFLVMAGFNENLIQDHVGYLQEIHIFISGYITDKQQSSLISNVTKYCSLFPFIIFTPFGYISKQINQEDEEWSSHNHMIRMDQDILEASPSLVIYQQEQCHSVLTGNKSVPGPSLCTGDKNKNLEANNNLANKDSVQLGQGQQGTSSNSNQGETNQSGERHFGSREQQDHVTSQEDPVSGEHPSDTDTEKHQVYFSVQACICKGESGLTTAQPQKHLRRLQMNGTFVAERKVVDRVQHSIVTFSRLSCQSLTVLTEEDLKTPLEKSPFSFHQIFLKVAIDSQCQSAEIHTVMPKTTSLENKENTVTQGSKVAEQVKGGVTLSLTDVKVALSASKTNELSSTVEKKTYKSGIKQYDESGNVWWSYAVDDPSERHHGKELVDVELPQVDYFLPRNSYENINDIHVKLNTYWVMRPTDSLKKGFLENILKRLSATIGKPSKEGTGYSTIVQHAKITVPHTIKRVYRFTDKFDFEAFDWGAPGKMAPALRKAVPDVDGKLQVDALCMPDENHQEISEIPL